jgi:predicted transcriptional regulator
LKPVSDIEEKWGTLVAQRGFAQVPNHLLLLNIFMDDKHKLTSTELLILVQLVGTWWRTSELPFPALSTIGERCGVSTRQVQRSINRLEKLGLIKRINRRTKGFMANNAYDLAPLAKLLNEVAKAFPNPYPRRIDKAAIEAFAAQLEASKAEGEGESI